MRKQRTIKKAFSFEGVGLHSGENCTIHLLPAECDEGVAFVSPQDIEIPAHWSHVCDTHYHTSLECNGARIALVEHLMAALAGCGVDNVRIMFDSVEIPIADGSARIFVEKIKETGIEEQEKNCRFLSIRKKIAVRRGEDTISIEPYDDGLAIDYSIEFSHPLIAKQRIDYHYDELSFCQEIAPARTFGRYEDWDELRSKNLALGASTDNAVVLKGRGILNEEGLRFEDEFVRHKLLDCVGDLFLSGAPLLGKLSVHRGGHELHHCLLKALFEDEHAWVFSH